jgi:hypothetical protein
MKTKRITMAAAAFAALAVHAETVALWKLDWSPYTGMNARCLVDPANDFDVVIQGQQKEPPSTRPQLPYGLAQEWSPLPPNPDATEGLLDTPASTNAIFYEHGILFSSTGVVSAINNPARSFTVEGWHRRDNWYVPPIGGSWSFFSLGAADGWRFFLNNLNDTNTLYFLLSDYRAPNQYSKRFPIPVSKDTLYRKWCHYALVYDCEGGDGLGTYELFINSASHGTVTNNSRQAAPGPATAFCLGGDASGSQYFAAGAYDYWRVCDEALTPDRFLNAGTPVTAPRTLAFYRLDVHPDGSFDLSNRAANAWHLTAPPPGHVSSQLTANVSQAVTAVPRDPAPGGPFLGSRAANAGSVTFNSGPAGSNAYLLDTTGLAVLLDTNRAWTAEAWVNFRELAGRQVIFDAKQNKGLGAGWMLLNHQGDDINTRYCLFIGSPPGYVAFPLSVVGETALNIWHHLALTFDPASGPGYQGTWELFLNGNTLGRIEYSNAWGRVTTATADFCVGGRASTFADALRGSMDLVRVSQGILVTNQFLRAEAPPPAIDPHTLAFWKLDSDGASADASSQVEPRYALGTAPDTASPAGSLQRVAGTLLKHDTTPGFTGDPAANAGSLLFTNGTALATGNLGVRLELDAPFTVEGWMKWDGGATREVQTLAGTRFDTETGLLLPPVGTANRVLFGIPSGWLLTLEKRGADTAFRIACDTAATNAFTGGTAVIGADLALLPAAQLAGRWRHVALAYDPAVDDNRGQWTLYLDGVETGSAANAHTPFLNHESPRFLLGGRAGGADSFDGLLDCWRASGGIRGAEDLLYFNVQRGTLLRVQ